MLLHELMCTHHDEILQACHAAAARASVRQQSAGGRREYFFRAGLHPGQVPFIFGAISRPATKSANGTRSQSMPTSTTSSTKCIDAGIATSIESPERATSIALEVADSLHLDADEILLTSAASNLLHDAIEFSRTRPGALTAQTDL